LLGGRRTGGPRALPGRTTVEKRIPGKARAASWSRIRLKQLSLDVVEADIKGFFDNIRWEWLERMLEQRIADGALLKSCFRLEK
jgi:retron-type reverse transcriptase